MFTRDPETKTRIKRKFRKKKKQATELGLATEDSFDKYISKRLSRILAVKRFILGWIALMILISVAVFLQAQSLKPRYLVATPEDGGILREGLVGKFTNANPIYAQTEVDRSVSVLIFSGLYKYDSSGALVPDLAEKYEVNEAGTSYVVTLKQNLKWQDGHDLTADDVVFTFNTIKNPEAKSFLISSWRGVTVKKIDNLKVQFILSTALSAFPNSFTTGILPKHAVDDIPVSQLRSAKFNNENPIGSGPFSYSGVELDQKKKSNNTIVVLRPSDNYHKGKAKIEKIVIRPFDNNNQMIDAYNDNQINSMSGLRVAPDNLDNKNAETTINRVPISIETMVFFKNTAEILKDTSVRRALVLAIDKKSALDTLKYPVLPIDEPLLKKQIGYDKKYAQISNDKQTAMSILDGLGWKPGPDGIRVKDGKQLKFKFVSSSNAEYSGITSNLQEQWRQIGVNVEVALQNDSELQTTVASHNYDAILYGISVGADPDVFAFWHSTQADIRSQSRLNFSEYKSSVADKSLEAGRTRTDATNRSIKYAPFLEAWQKDYPALALYQQQFVYIATDNLQGFDNTYMHSATDRYSNVVNWTVKKSLQKIQ